MGKRIKAELSFLRTNSLDPIASRISLPLPPSLPFAWPGNFLWWCSPGMGISNSIFSSINSVLSILIECQLCKIAMETQVESLKSTGGIVQSSHIHGYFNEQKGYMLVQPTPGLVICLHSAQIAESGDRWRKICKADNVAFCSWQCNARFPGKRREEPGLWFLLEQRAEFSYICFCSIVSITHTFCTRAGPTKGCPGAWWQPSLQHLAAQQGPWASEEQSLNYVRHSSHSRHGACPWQGARKHRIMVPMGVLEEPWDFMLFVLKKTAAPLIVLRKVTT